MALVSAHCRHHRSAHPYSPDCRGHNATDDLIDLRCLDAAARKVQFALSGLYYHDAQADEAQRRDAATDLVMAALAVHAFTIADAPRLAEIAATRARYRARAERGMWRRGGGVEV